MKIESYISLILAMIFSSGLYMGEAISEKDWHSLVSSVILLIAAIIVAHAKIKPNKDQNLEVSDTTENQLENKS